VHLLVIYNPRAGNGRAGKHLPAVEALFRSEHLLADIRRTAYPGHGTAILRDADLSTYDGIIAAGGDGTLFEVVNGFYARSERPEIPLGILPVGTGNAFAREFGLRYGDWNAALHIIRSGTTRRIDVGHFKTRDDEGYFLNILGFGFVVDANRTAQRLKFLGNIAYTLGVICSLIPMKSGRAIVEIDGQRIEQDNLFVEVSNTRYTGTSFLIAPQARVDDGLLDVTLVGRMSRRRLLRLFPTVFSGAHVKQPDVAIYQAKHIRIRALGALSPDGEMRGCGPVEITCLHRDLPMFWPAQ